MKLQFVITSVLSLTSLVVALPTTAPRNQDEIAARDAISSEQPPPSLFPRQNAPTYNGQEIDLPAFITAVFNGLANTIAATGGAAANTIAATGGMLANAGSVPAPVTPEAKANSTILGRSLGEHIGQQVGEKARVEMLRRLTGGSDEE